MLNKSDGFINRESSRSLDIPKLEEKVRGFMLNPLAFSFFKRLSPPLPEEKRTDLRKKVLEAAERPDFEEIRSVLSFADDFSSLKEESPRGNTEKFLGELRDFLKISEKVSELLPLSKETQLRELRKEFKKTFTEDLELNESSFPELKKLKSHVSRLRERISRILREKFSPSHIITVRDGRVVVNVSREEVKKKEFIVHSVSRSGNSYYGEVLETVGLNNELQTAVSTIEVIVEKVKAEFFRKVMENRHNIIHTLRELEEHSYIFSLASLLKSGEFVFPSFQERLNLKRVRNILLYPKSVPQTVTLAENEKVYVITGPNASGKTVLLNTVGTCFYLAHLGFPLPAEEGSSLPEVERIEAVINVEGRIEENLSTFSARIKRIAEVLKNSTAQKCLVLIDEPGTGTDPKEGGAIGKGVVWFLSRTDSISFVTTHFPEMKTAHLEFPGVKVGTLVYDLKELKPTYEFLEGVPGKSLGLTVARHYGLQTEILEKVEEFLEKSEVEDLVNRLNELITDAKKEKHRAEALLEKVVRDREKLLRKEEEFKSSVRRWNEEKVKEINSLVERYRRELQRALKEVKGLVKDFSLEKAERELRERIKGLEKLGKRLMEEGRTADRRAKVEQREANFKEGDTVVSELFDGTGEIIEMREGGKAEVRVGTLVFVVPVEKLRQVGSTHERDVPEPEVKVSGKAPPLSINLHGMRVDEALEAVDKALNDAVLSGTTTLIVVHGKGTGTLRREVRRFLSSNPLVSSVREGTPSEGGPGVTVVYLK